MCNGIFTILLIDRHFLSIIRIAPDRCVYQSLILCRMTDHDSPINTVDRMYLDLFRNLDMRLIILTYDQRSGRILIDSVDNARTDLSIDAGQRLLTVIHNGINQCTIGMPRCRMHDHALWLIDDQKVFIFI